MSTAPRFKKYIKNITITNPGSGYYSGGQVFTTTGKQAYAIDYFAEDYVLNYDTVEVTTLATLKVGIPYPSSTIPGDVLVPATATVTLTNNTNGSVSSISITDGGDGYTEVPIIYLLGSPTAVVNLSAVDLNRDDGVYEDIPTTSVDDIGIGEGLTAVVTIENGEVISIIPFGGDNYYSGELIAINPTDMGGAPSDAPVIFRVSEINGGTGATFEVELDIINKAQDYYVEKLAPSIENQIPEYIRDEYPLFATFIKKYYDFLESNTEETGIGPSNIIHTLRDRLDVDFVDNTEATNTDFLDQFFEDYGKDFPVAMLADKELLIKNIRDFYTAKGSAQAIELLFRIMYDEDIEVFVPNQFVLRPSDNNWSREYVVKVYKNTFLSLFGEEIYDPVDLEGREVKVHYYESSGSITTRKVKTANVTQVKKIAYTSPESYEISLDLDPTFVIPGVGTGATYTPVLGGKISIIANISAADALRPTGTYTIASNQFTSDGNGYDATFEVTVDGVGGASVVATNVGLDFNRGEIVTIPDQHLGNNGAADLTFEVTHITEGRIHSITIDTAGSQYSANVPLKITPSSLDTIINPANALARVTDGEVTSVIFPEDANGLGYNNLPVITESTYFISTFISLADDTGTENGDKKVIPSRILSTVVPKSNSGAAQGGFAVGQTFKIDETATLTEYAIDYFAEDYTLIGIANNAFVKISSIDSSGYPTKLNVIAIGSGFFNSTFDINIESESGETCTLTCTTGYNAVYPGIFDSTKGFLSNANRLQDNRLYQAFSYQVRSERPKSEWGEYVKRAAHPSGMVAFADLQIKNTIDFSATTAVDTDLFFYVVMPDIEEVLTIETIAKDVHLAAIADSFISNEPVFFLDIGLAKTDSVSWYSDTFSYAIDYFAEDYVVDSTPAIIFDVGKYIIDESYVTTDTINAFGIEEVLEELYSIDDTAPLFDIGKVLDESCQIDDTLFFAKDRKLTDVARAEDFDTEYAIDYFAEDYTAGQILVRKDIERFLNILIIGPYAIDYFAEDYILDNLLESADNAAEIYYVMDTPAIDLTTSASDSFAMQDVIDVVRVSVRDATDSIQTADVLNTLQPFLFKTDSIIMEDDAVELFKGVLHEERTVVTQELRIDTVGKNLIESPAIFENVSKIIAINTTDNMNISESGSVTQQDFMDSADYFLEDYVASEVRSIA